MSPTAEFEEAVSERKKPNEGNKRSKALRESYARESLAWERSGEELERVKTELGEGLRNLLALWMEKGSWAGGDFDSGVNVVWDGEMGELSEPEVRAKANFKMASSKELEAEAFAQARVSKGACENLSLRLWKELIGHFAMSGALPAESSKGKDSFHKALEKGSGGLGVFGPAAAEAMRRGRAMVDKKMEIGKMIEERLMDLKEASLLGPDLAEFSGFKAHLVVVQKEQGPWELRFSALLGKRGGDEGVKIFSRGPGEDFALLGTEESGADEIWGKFQEILARVLAARARQGLGRISASSWTQGERVARFEGELIDSGLETKKETAPGLRAKGI